MNFSELGLHWACTNLATRSDTDEHANGFSGGRLRAQQKTSSLSAIRLLFLLVSVLSPPHYPRRTTFFFDAYILSVSLGPLPRLDRLNYFFRGRA